MGLKGYFLDVEFMLMRWIWVFRIRVFRIREFEISNVGFGCVMALPIYFLLKRERTLRVEIFEDTNFREFSQIFADYAKLNTREI